MRNCLLKLVYVVWFSLVCLTSANAQSDRDDFEKKRLELTDRIQHSIKVATEEFRPLYYGHRIEMADLEQEAKIQHDISINLMYSPKEGMQRARHELANAEATLEAWSFYEEAINSSEDDAIAHAIVEAKKLARENEKIWHENPYESYQQLLGREKAGHYNRFANSLQNVKPENVADLQDHVIKTLDEARIAQRVYSLSVEAMTSEDPQEQKRVLLQTMSKIEALRDEMELPRLKFQEADSELRIKHYKSGRQLASDFFDLLFRKSATVDGEFFQVVQKPAKPRLELESATFVAEYQSETGYIVVNIHLANFERTLQPFQNFKPRNFEGYPMKCDYDSHIVFDVNDLQVRVRRYRPSEGGVDLKKFVKQAIDLERLAIIELDN